MVALWCVKRYSKKKIGFWHFKVPVSATPNEDDRVSLQKRVWVFEWVLMSSQESQNPSSSDNCCFSSGEEFSLTKYKQIEVGKAMRPSSKQKKNVKLWDVPEVTSFVTNLSLRITQSTSLGVAKVRNLKLDFMAKSIRIHFFDLNTFLNVRDTKT